jgi:NADH:ubiquinone reductase (H+-translocating)
MYLIGFKNRLTTMLHWAVSFLLRGRPQRTTTRQQIVARTLMARLTEAEEELKRARGDLDGVLPTPEQGSELEGGVVVAESAEPKAHPS